MHVLDSARPERRANTRPKTDRSARTEPLSSTRWRFGRRLTGLVTLLVAALVLALGLALAPTALASNDGGGNGGRAATTTHENIVKIDYTVEFNQVGTKYYGEWQGAYPSQIDWGSDGCSFPGYVYVIPVVPAYYASFFEPSCTIHDFGYRNYGHVHKISMTQATKDLIDKRLLLNMYAQCTSKSGASRNLCDRAANDIYNAVSVAKDAHKAFFGS